MVDFEYGGANCAAYDIGNHFCEFAGLIVEIHCLLYVHVYIKLCVVEPL